MNLEIMDFCVKSSFFIICLVILPISFAQECPTFWAGYGDSCYRFRWINKKSWQDAKTWCQAQNGDLLKLETTQERSWIINKINITDTNHNMSGTTWWMGLNDINMTSQWVWGDGSLADNSVVLWSPGDPNRAGSRDCAGVRSGKVYLQTCAALSNYICERNRKVILPCNTDENFQTFNGHCYRVHTELQSWYDAKTTCDNEGAELATIDNAMDQTVVIDFARNTQRPYWIGLQSLQTVNNGPVTWIWSNTTGLNPSLTFWNTNQPQITSNRQNSSCVYMSNTTTDNNAWVVDWCGVRRSFVCKKPEGVCPRGWVAHQKKCYQFNIQYQYSWAHASSYCHSQGSTLIHIFGDAATYFLRGYFEDMRAAGVDSFWIGAFDNNTDSGAFIWSDGQNTTRYERWLHNPPPNTKGQQDCVYISTSDSNVYWRPTSACFTNKAFVCTVPIENSNTIVPISTPAPSYTCDATWQIHGNMCYQFNDTRLSWSAARTACQGEGADLVKITNDDIQGFISSNTNQQEYWIGLNDRKTEKTYVWLSETIPSNYTRWNPHEPNNLQGENCVETRGTGWNDFDCSRQIKYICQKYAKNYQLPVSKSTQPPQKYSAKCGLLWEEDPNSDYCYMFNSEALDWEDSRGMCLTHGGDLVSIITREESFYINARIQAVSSPTLFNIFWIGANDRSSEGGWRWSDGGPFAYLNWGPGQPNDNQHNEDCGIISYTATEHTAVWDDVACNRRLGYICKKLGLSSSTTRKPTPSPTPPPNMVYGCKPRWKGNGDYCYLFSHQQRNWYDARTRCGQAGGSLVSIASQDEQNFVYSQMQNYNGTAVWIGLNDLTTNRNFQWVDGSTVTYTNWAPTEPNNFFGAPEDCVMMYTSGCAKSGWTCKGGMWNDATCDTTSVIAGFICKARKQLMSSTPKPENVGCTLPAVGYDDNCYFPVSGITNTWLDAEADCSNRFKGHLAAVNDRYTQAFLSSFMAHKNDVFWIGMSDINVTGTYYWINGLAVRFTFWSASHTGNEKHSCVSMRNTHPRGMWENKNCTEKHHYWCQFPRSTSNHTTPQVTMPTTTVTASCPSGWTGYGPNCYKVFNPTVSNRKTWMEARDYCRSIGSNLASIHSQDEDNFFSRTLLLRYNTNFWIGLNDRDNENGYVWIDGTGTDFTNWYRGEPNNVKDSEDCVEYSSYTNSWNDNNCYKAASFICKAPGGFQLLTTVAPPTVATSSVCGTDLRWIYYNGSCYYVSSPSDSTKNVYDATQFCNSKGGYLASIHSIDENNMLLTQITKNNIQSYWIGLNDLSTSTFSWFDNSVFDFEFWSQGEPNNGYGAERCVAITDRGGLWNDDNCNENYGFICKKSVSSRQPITPAPTPLIQGGCDHGFIGVPHSNKCFLIQSTNVVSWRTATDKCRAFGKGYDIASISSALEQEFIIANTKGLDNSGLWIGLNSFRHVRHFSWQDSSEFTYQNWGKYQPNSYYTQACVKQNLPGNTRIPKSDRGKWDDIGCNNLLGYICEGQKVSGLPIATPPGFLCKSGYIPYGQGCYKMYSQTDWQTAATNCSYDGGSLTSIIDVYEEAFIKSVYINLNQSVWLGMTFSAKGTYTWLDGWPVLYTNWGSGQPVKAINGGCVAMINGMWSDQNCNSKFNFVCKITSATPPPPTSPPPGTCPKGQQHRGIYCYQGDVGASKSWPEANYICQKIGMNLLSIHSQEESKFILNTMVTPTTPPSRYSRTPNSFWIGMNKGTSDGFTWTDNTPIDFLNWSPHEPSDPMNSTTEECIEMFTGTGKWNDVSCFVNRGYICKGLAANLTTTAATMTIPNKQSSATTGSKQTTPRGIIDPFTPLIPPTGPTTPNPIPNIPGVSNYNGGKATASTSNLSTGGIVAILVSVVFVLVIIGLAAIFIKRRSSGAGSGLGVGGIDNSLYYEKHNEQVNISNGNSIVSHEEDA